MISRVMPVAWSGSIPGTRGLETQTKWQLAPFVRCVGNELIGYSGSFFFFRLDSDSLGAQEHALSRIHYTASDVPSLSLHFSVSIDEVSFWVLESNVPPAVRPVPVPAAAPLWRSASCLGCQYMSVVIGFDFGIP